MPHGHIAGWRCDRAGGQVAAGGPPCSQPAVENADIGNAGSGQDPPGPRRTGSIPVVVDDGGYAGAHTPPPRGGLDAATGRQRVATAPGDGVVAEFVVEGDIDRDG